MTWTRRRFLRVAAISTAAAACAPKKLLERPPSVRVIFYTDVHARPVRAVTRALEAAAVAIGSHHADVVIAGGDMVDAGTGVSAAEARSMWIVYRSMLVTLGGQVHHVVGNHDLVGPTQAVQKGADPRAIVREAFGHSRTYGSFDAADYHFVLLDSVEVTRDKAGYRGYVSNEQLDWLSADIDRIPTTKPVIVATHMPLHTAVFGPRVPGSGPPDRVVVNAPAVLDILMRRKLVLVLQGHLHKAEAIQEGGVTFLTGGAICGQWCEENSGGTPPGFVIASVKGEVVEWQYVGF